MANETKHTPGPWKTDTRKDGSVEILDSDGDGVMATVYGDDAEPLCWPATANAKLIAAAPDLADALEQMLKVEVADPGHVFTLSAQHNAEAALRKAGRLP